MDQEQVEKFAKWWKIGGIIFIFGVLLAGIIFAFTNYAKKPLNPVEDQHWTIPDMAPVSSSK
jgi:predicted negative regulator of RcsB-dependent stress response